MAADENKSAILVADGHFFLSGTLHIRQTVIFEGTGRNHPTVGGQRSSPVRGSSSRAIAMGIRLHSSADGLGGVPVSFQFSDLTIYCKESRPNKIPNTNASPPLLGQTGHGVHGQLSFPRREHERQNFGEHGFFISATALHLNRSNRATPAGSCWTRA